MMTEEYALTRVSLAREEKIHSELSILSDNP